MLSGYKDLSSVTETLDEAVELDRNVEMKKRRKSSHYVVDKSSFVDDDRAGVAMWRKVLFGFGNFSRYTVIGIQAYFLNVFLLEVVDMGTFWAGNILLIKQIYDGFTDPLVGGLSDSISTRWGRRKPWILLASIPSAIFWVLQWYTPGFVANSQPAAISYYLIILLIFSTMNTFVSVPYNAMVPDIAITYNDRTAVVLFQEVFGLSAVIIFSYFQAEAVKYFPDEDNPGLYDYEKGYFVASLITVWAVLIPIIVGVIFVKEKPFIPDTTNDNLPAYKRVGLWFKKFFITLFQSLMFKEFALIVLVFVLCMIAVYLFVNNFVLYIKYVVKAEDQTSFLMLFVQVTCTVSIFFWAFLSKHVGKKITFLCGVVLWIGGSVVIYFINENDVTLLYVVCVFRAFGSGVGYLIPLAMLPDIIELDRLKNKKSREGILYSLMILLQKTGVGVAVTCSNYILGLAGYINPNGETVAQQADDYQPDSVLLSFRILMTVIPIVCLLISLVCIYFIDVSEELLNKLDAEANGRDLSFKPQTDKDKLLPDDF